MCFLRKSMVVIVFVFFLTSNETFANTLGLQLNGISTHFSDPPSNAPRKLDPSGINVFNPGLGIDFDFRSSGMQTGFSPVTRIGFFKNCPDFFSVYSGIGLRYRALATDSSFIGGSILGGVYFTKSEVSSDDTNKGNPPQYEKKTLPLIIPTLETGFQFFEKYTAQLNLSYVPVLNLMFTSVSFSYSFL